MRTDKSRASSHGLDDEYPSDPPTIEVKAESVEVLRNAANWSSAELARRMGVDQSALSRLLRGDLKPGSRTIGGLLRAFSVRFPRIGFYQLFEIVCEDGQVIKPPVDGPAGGIGEDVAAVIEEAGRSA